jgi:tetratricopeptide (TPR) repeat protein
MSGRVRGFFLLCGLVGLIYGNTFHASWHLDDLPNITDAPQLHLENFQPESLRRAVDFQGKVSRPLARLSFAFNWYFSKDRVTSYHIVNIAIHLLTAFFLFLTILELLKTPNIADNYKGSEYFIALLSAVLWAANPVQTQAVTYIVQRMASMVALFYLVSLYLFIKARLAEGKARKSWLFTGCVAGFLMALATKENAVILPASLVLIEVVFFRDIGKPQIRRKIIIAGSLAVVSLFLLASILQNGNLFSFLEGYHNRFFSLSERVLTEPRIVVFYLSQLFYPVPTRLCLEHYFPLSTSFWNPWTTLPAMGLIAALIVLAFFQIRKRPLLSFAILFFFLNHLVESTVIPLELVFEHRNYLPSLFLFVPVAAGIKSLMDSYRSQKNFMYYVFVSFIVLLVAGIGFGTYVRNMAWKTEKTLWEDAIKKTPQNARSYHNLAFSYYEKIGEHDKAIELYKKANGLWLHSKNEAPLPANNIASIYFQKGDWKRALEYWEKALGISKDALRLRYRLALVYAKKLGHLEKALIHLDLILSRNPDHKEALNLKGFVLLNQHQPKKALICFKQCLKIDPYDREVLRNTAVAFYLLGDYKRAEMYLKYLLPHLKKDIFTALYLVAINLKTDDITEAEEYTDVLLKSEKENKLINNLIFLNKHKWMSEKDQRTLCTWLIEKIEKITEKRVGQLRAFSLLEDNEKK